MSVNTQLRYYKRSEVVSFRRTNERFGGLSNMAPGFPLLVNGIQIKTSEALYQACRFPHLPEIQRMIIEEKSPMTAKMLSKPYRKQSRADWDSVKVKIMRWCLRLKLAQNWETFGEVLYASGDLPIVEDSRKDDFWGATKDEDHNLVGQNILGRLLMELRDHLRSPRGIELRKVALPPVKDFLLYGQSITYDEMLMCPEQPELLPEVHSTASNGNFAGTLTWTGEVPPEKLLAFYTKVLSKLVSARGMKLIISVEAAQDGAAPTQKIDEAKAALRELGLNDQVQAL